MSCREVSSFYMSGLKSHRLTRLKCGQFRVIAASLRVRRGRCISWKGALPLTHRRGVRALKVPRSDRRGRG